VPETDVVIMGGGLAGLVAGNRARELGLQAIIVEQGLDEDYLCDSRVATGAIHLASSSPKAEPASIVDRISEKTRGFANRDLALALAERAGDAIDWLEEAGAEFLPSPNPNQRRYWMAPTRGRQSGLEWKGWGPDLILKRLTERFLGRGGRLMLGTKGKELLFDGETCTGLRVETKDGVDEIRARAVLIADGGFQANSDLIGRFIAPSPDRIVLRNTKTAGGTGLLMAEKAGANLVGMQYFYGHLLARNALHNDALWPYPTMDVLASVSIVVDSKGNRLADEGLGGIFLANQIAWQQDPVDYFLIVDDALWNSEVAIRTADPANPDSPNPDVVEKGGVLNRADSIEALAAEAGIDGAGLRRTVDAYNAAVEAGDLSRLEPKRSVAQQQAVRPIVKAPFYAVPLCIGLTFTMGGPAVDGNSRVLRQDGSAIPGLFVIGSAIGGLEGGESVGYWGGLSQALITGLRSAEYIADMNQVS
jgi:fumarate reductase flavoprotein subunit